MVILLIYLLIFGVSICLIYHKIECLQHRRMYDVHVCDSQIIDKENVKNDKTCKLFFTDNKALESIIDEEYVYAEVIDNKEISIYDNDWSKNHVVNFTKKRLHGTEITLNYYVVYATENIKKTIKKNNEEREKKVINMFRQHQKSIIDEIFNDIEFFFEISNGNVVGFVFSVSFVVFN